MPWNEIFTLVETYHIETLNANGVHAFRMYFYQGKMITLYEYLMLRRFNATNLYYLNHVGVKQQLTENFWIFCMFTSQSTSILYDNIVMHNINLTNNMHQYVNRCIIVSNSNFSNYCTISNNINHFPQYIKINSNINNEAFHNEIVRDSISGFRLSVLQADFNNPYILVDHLYNYYNNISASTSSIIHRNGSNLNNLILNHPIHIRKANFLRSVGIRNEDIIHFANNFNQNLTINNIKYSNHNLFYENSIRRI